MIKNRRILILSNSYSKNYANDEKHLANELCDLGNDVFCLKQISKSAKWQSIVNCQEKRPGFTHISIEVGFLDSLLLFFGKKNVIERLASDFVFEIGKLFDVVLSFEAEPFKNLSIFFAKVNLLVVRSQVQPDLINSSIDHIIVLDKEQASAAAIWKRITSQNSKKSKIDEIAIRELQA